MALRAEEGYLGAKRHSIDAAAQSPHMGASLLASLRLCVFAALRESLSFCRARASV
jgi:hypothetical protein